MKTKKIAKFIGIVSIVAITSVFAFLRPSATPNNNNVFRLIDSKSSENVKIGTGNNGGISVDTFMVTRAARFDAQVFINKFITGPDTDDADIEVGTASTKSRMEASGNIIAGEYLQSDQLKNDSMQRVCRDLEGKLILCGGASIAVPDQCPNIEGIQTTLQAELFMKDVSGNCVKPVTITPPPTPPQATIDVRYMPINSTKKFTVLNMASGNVLSNRVTSWYAPAIKIDFDAPLTQPVTFNVGYCVNHGVGTPMTVCRGLPRSFISFLKAPDVISDWAIGGLINAYAWSGQSPLCAGLIACSPSNIGPIDRRSAGRHVITLPAGTTSTGWMLHADGRWTEQQRWNPPYTPSDPNLAMSEAYYRFWAPLNQHKNYKPDLTNMYFFNVSDPTGKFNLTNLQNISSYNLVWTPGSF